MSNEPRTAADLSDELWYEALSGNRDAFDRLLAEAHNEWECGVEDGERLGYACGRPRGHKGMHRRRTPATSPAPALDVEQSVDALVAAGWKRQDAALFIAALHTSGYGIARLTEAATYTVVERLDRPGNRWQVRNGKLRANLDPRLTEAAEEE